VEGYFGISMRLWVGNDDVWMTIGNGKGVRGLWEILRGFIYADHEMRKMYSYVDTGSCSYTVSPLNYQAYSLLTRQTVLAKRAAC